MNGDYFWLTDAQFAKLKPYLPTDTRGKPWVDDRRIISGIIHVINSAIVGSMRQQRMARERHATTLPALGGQGHTERYLPCTCRGGWTNGPASHRLLGRAGASLRGLG